MSGLDDMKAALEKKLDERRAIHVERTEKESADFRAVLMSGIKIPPPSELTRRVDALGSNWNKTESVLPRTTGLVEISGSAGLKKIDETFSQLFELHSFYSTDRLAYPTVYSTTLEDFYTPMLESYDVSQTTLQEIRNQSVEEAKIVAREKYYWYIEVTNWVEVWSQNRKVDPHATPILLICDRDIIRGITRTIIYSAITLIAMGLGRHFKS